MLKRKFGTTALEIQYKYKLDFADTIYYITKAKEEFGIVKNGTKLKLIKKAQNDRNDRK